MTSPTHHRSFGSGRAAITFDIDGEVFTASTVSAEAYYDFVQFLQGSQDVNANGSDVNAQLNAAGSQMDGLFNLFASVMSVAEYERFRAFCKTDHGPSVPTMVEIVEYLASSTAERPTVPSSGSSNGRPAGGTSTVDSSSPVSTPAASASPTT